MDQTTRKLVIEAVKTAIITEIRGQQIYQAAAEKAADPAARHMFLTLAEDEDQHKKFLMQNFKSLVESGTWAVPATPENLTPLDHPETITQDFLNRVKGGEFELAVVAAGAELERSAINFYAKAASECPDPESAKVFRFLADWEKEHLNSLVDLQGRLTDAYFSDQGFSRF